VSFKNPTSMEGLQMLNLSLLKVMLRCVNNGVMTIKPGYQTTGNASMIWSDESSFTLFPTSARVYVWRTPKQTYKQECLVPTVKHLGRICEGLGSNIVVQYSVGPIITLHSQITARKSVDRLDPDVISKK
jgi:hypothetical protein